MEWFDRAGYPPSHPSQYADDVTSPSTYYTSAADCDRAAFEGRIRQLIAESGRTRGRVLDVGCSVGTFLEAAADKGWEGVGVEPNPAAAAIAEARGSTVVVGFFAGDLARRLRDFDAVHLSDVIEHVFDPVEMLADVLHVLKPGGVVLVATPDFDTFSSRLLQRKPREHVVHFRRGALVEAAVRAGFQVIRVERVARPRSVAALQHSTTFGPAGKWCLRAVSGPRATRALDFLLAPLFRDTLLLTARRPVIHEACA